MLSGSRLSLDSTKIPESAPIARAFLIVSWTWDAPIDIATTSFAIPFSFNLKASSTAISSKGFIDILTFSNSTPELSFLTLTFTL